MRYTYTENTSKNRSGGFNQMCHIKLCTNMKTPELGHGAMSTC